MKYLVSVHDLLGSCDCDFLVHVPHFLVFLLVEGLG